MFYREIIWNSETLQVIAARPSPYKGPADRMCGSTGAQKAAQTQESDIASQMSQNFSTIFGQNESILKNLTASLAPIVAAGPNQFGYNPAEAAALRTQASSQIAAAGNAESNAVRSSEAARGGGNTELPSGSEAAIDAGLAENAGTQEANAQLGITTSGYNAGRAEFNQADQMLAAAPGELENPATSAGGAAENAEQDALSGATQIQQADDAWEGIVGGIVGSVVPHLPGMNQGGKP